MQRQSDDRAYITAWLESRGRSIATFDPLSGDVSPRRYARIELSDGSRAIVASYPPDMLDACRRFEQTTELLEQARVRVPDILESDCERGLMLLEDVGSETLFDRRSRPLSDRAHLIDAAIASARRIASLPAADVSRLGPPLDEPLLWRELEQTIELFLHPRGLLGDAPSRTEASLARLCHALGGAPLVPCHRDFMARNLVPSDDGGVSILDHQDLRLGPPGYDLASLLNDSFFPPHEIEISWVAAVFPGSEQRLAYHRAAAQRTLKAIGTFTAFAHRGCHRHLPLVRPTLLRALHHLALAPETAGLGAEVRDRWSWFASESED